MTDTDIVDINNIEDLRREDVAASLLGDFEKLKCLMD